MKRLLQEQSMTKEKIIKYCDENIIDRKATEEDYRDLASKIYSPKLAEEWFPLRKNVIAKTVAPLAFIKQLEGRASLCDQHAERVSAFRHSQVEWIKLFLKNDAELFRNAAAIIQELLSKVE